MLWARGRRSWSQRATDAAATFCQGRPVLTVPPRSETVPAVARVLAGTCVRLLVRADQAAVRATDATSRLRSSAVRLPGPRRGYDEP